jgi:hypothetical protein
MRRIAALPALRGGLIALLAAVLFGVSTPLVQRFGAGIGSLSTVWPIVSWVGLAGCVALYLSLPPWALATGFGSLTLLLGVRFVVRRRKGTRR